MTVFAVAERRPLVRRVGDRRSPGVLLDRAINVRQSAGIDLIGASDDHRSHFGDFQLLFVLVDVVVVAKFRVHVDVRGIFKIVQFVFFQIERGIKNFRG